LGHVEFCGGRSKRTGSDGSEEATELVQTGHDKLQEFPVHGCGSSGYLSAAEARSIGHMSTNSRLHPLERKVAMSRLAQAIRSRHEIKGTRRELNRAIASATTPAMRDELILVAQRGGNDF
jgi:isopentenyl phosphate kinase